MYIMYMYLILLYIIILYFSNKEEITLDRLSNASIFALCGSREKFTGAEVY